MRNGVVILALALGACNAGPARLGDGNPSLGTAQTALASGAYDLALRVCNNTLAAGRRDADVLACQGNALTGLGRDAEAAASFNAALAASPNNTDALIGAGRQRLATNPAEAESLFLRALARQPRNAVALNNLGVARDLQGRHSDAQTAYGEAIAAAPDSRPAQVNLALSMALSGRATEAVRILQPIADRSDATLRERHDYAAVLAMDGRRDEATRYLTPELSGAPLDDALSGFRALPNR